VTAAASSGTTLLYLHRTVVDEHVTPAAIREVDLPADGEAARHALLKELKRVAGWTSEVEVGFAYQGVMNVSLCVKTKTSLRSPLNVQDGGTYIACGQNYLVLDFVDESMVRQFGDPVNARPAICQ
jgi:hypothetical protein